MKKYIFTFLTVLACLWGNEVWGQTKYGLVGGPGKVFQLYEINTLKQIWKDTTLSVQFSTSNKSKVFHTVGKVEIYKGDSTRKISVSKVRALDVNSGKQIWNTDVLNVRWGSFLACTENAVFLNVYGVRYDDDDAIIQLNASTGKQENLIDIKQTKFGKTFTPRILNIQTNGDILYFTSYHNYKTWLTAFNTITRQRLWSKDIGNTRGFENGNNLQFHPNFIILESTLESIPVPENITTTAVVIDYNGGFISYLSGKYGHYTAFDKSITILNSNSIVSCVGSKLLMFDTKNFQEMKQITFTESVSNLGVSTENNSLIVNYDIKTSSQYPSAIDSILDLTTGNTKTKISTSLQRYIPCKMYGIGNLKYQIYDNQQKIVVLDDVVDVFPFGVTPTLNVAATAQNTVATANTANITLTTNNAWTASSNATWLKVNPTSGNAGTNLAINFTIDANVVTTSRTGVVTFTAGGLTKTFTVTQAGTIAPTLTLSATAQNAVATATTASITLTTNNSWTANSNATWLKVSPTSGNAGTNLAVNFTIDANTATSTRTGVVTFTAGGLTQTFTVTQAGVVAPTLTLSATAQNAVATATTANITLTTNNSWTASSNVTWLKVSPTSGNAGTNIAVKFTIDANNSTTERKGTVTFTANNVTQTYTITQAGTVTPRLTLSVTAQNVVATASTTSITLTANNSWTVNSNAAWLKISPTSGNNGTNLTINFTIDANTATTARIGVVTFTAGGLTQTYTVTQAGASA